MDNTKNTNAILFLNRFIYNFNLIIRILSKKQFECRLKNE